MTAETDGRTDVSRPAALAGAVLALLGSVESLIAFLFFVYAWLFVNPSALPAWADPGSVPAGASLQLALLGATVLCFAAAQVVAGLAVRRSSDAWARWMGVGLAVAGAGIALAATLPGAGGRPATPVFLPIVVAYGYVALTLALRLRRS